MTLRGYRLDEAREAVIKAVRFRRPQRLAFDAVHSLVASFDDDLPRLDQGRLEQQVAEAGYMSGSPPRLLFALATGVGKTRLMGALIAYLHRAGQSSNFLILAPRTAILDKLEREALPGAEKYLFVDTNLVPEPSLCFRSNVEGFTPGSFNVFVLSPQSITGGDRRFARPSEFRGTSLLDYLKNCEDLVVFADEAHHLGGGDEHAAWMDAVADLSPRLYFGLTATPRDEDAGAVMYSYDLAECLREGLYTKGVEVLVEPQPTGVSDEDWDRQTVDLALSRLSRKREALTLFAKNDPGFPFVEPVALICARDTDHADTIGRWLVEARGLDEQEVLVTHSERKLTEEELERLSEIDRPTNRVKVVVNVFRLTEGWDVTNVYVVAPLRKMATFVDAVQTMGRGLRLPAGHRVDDAIVDILDVLCCGKEDLQDVLAKAIEMFGDQQGAGPPIAVVDAPSAENEPGPPTAQLRIDAVRDVEITIPLVRKVPRDPDLDFTITSLGTLGSSGAVAVNLQSLQVAGVQGVQYDLPTLVRLASTRVIAALPYLSEFEHGSKVEALTEAFLRDLGATDDRPVAVDPMRLALHVSEQISTRYHGQAPTYETMDTSQSLRPDTIDVAVPEGMTAPIGRMPVRSWEKSVHLRMPISGWAKCVHEAASFESRGEYAAANVLDQSAAIEWWWRNDPARLRIPTPLTHLEPDFIFGCEMEGKASLGALEVKGGVFWDGEGSPARLKADAAVVWIAAVNAGGARPPWEFAVVLDQDAIESTSFEQMLQLAVRRG